MSVINTMLKDLEQRQAPEGHGRYQPPRRSALWIYLLLTGSMMALAAGGSWWWLDHQGAGRMNEGRLSQPNVAVPSVASHPAPAQSAAEPPTATISSAITTLSPPLSAATAAAIPVRVAAAPAPVTPVEPDSVRAAASPERSTLPPVSSTTPAETDDALLGPDEGPQVTEASLLNQPEAQPKGELQIEEEQMTPAQMAALDRRKGMQALARGDLTQARELFDRALDNAPRDRELRERLASLLYGEGRLQEARQLLEQGVAIDPGYANFRLLQARLAMAMGDKPAALQVLAMLDPLVAVNMDYYATRAALAQELAQYGTATRSYQQLTLAQPGEGRWWLGLAISLDKQGRTLAARDAYQRASTLNLSTASRQFVLQRLRQLES